MLTMPDWISGRENIKHILAGEDGIEMSLHESRSHPVHDFGGAGIADIDLVGGDTDDRAVLFVLGVDVAGAVTGQDGVFEAEVCAAGDEGARDVGEWVGEDGVGFVLDILQLFSSEGVRWSRYMLTRISARMVAGRRYASRCGVRSVGEESILRI